MLEVDDVDIAAGLLALKFSVPDPETDDDEVPGSPTGDASEIVVCDGKDAAMLAAATGVNVTLSMLAIESVEDLARGLFISSC